MDPSPIFPSETVTNFGTHIISVGDVNGDLMPDFGVSGTVDGQGFVLVYLGSASGIDLSSPNLIIRGINPPPWGTYFSYCGAGNFTGAVTSGSNLIDSIAVGEPGFGDSMLHIIPGDESLSNSGQVIIDLDGLTGTEPILTLQADDTNSFFGFTCSDAGDILPTPGASLVAAGDILISLLSSIGGDHDSPVFLIPGRPITGPSTETISIEEPAGDKTGEDATMIRLQQEISVVANYPSSITGGHDLTGDGVPDIIIGHSERAAVYIFDGERLAVISESLSPMDSRAVRVDRHSEIGLSWAGANGFIVNQSLSGYFSEVAVIQDWDNWHWQGAATPDLLFCDIGTTAVYMGINYSISDNPVDLGLFPYRTELSNPAGLSGGPIGVWADSGDLNNDGLPDAIFGTSSGEIVIMK